MAFFVDELVVCGVDVLVVDALYGQNDSAISTHILSQ